MKRAFRLLALLACSGLATAAAARDSEQVWIPTRLTAGFFGGDPIRLEATLYKPAGDGPFPLLIFNHGSTGGVIPASRTLRPDWLAPFALRHGFALLAPMRRGRGRSDGLYSEAYACDSVRMDAGLRHAMDDMDAILEYSKALAFVDPARIVLAGASRGGILSVVYAAQRPGAASAVVNFAGGWHGEGCRTDFNVSTYAAAGRRTKTPTLWLYAQNDSYYSADAIRVYADAFARGGGSVILRLYPPVAGDGHLFYRRQLAWEADFGEFVDSLRLTMPRNPARRGPPPDRL
jgi:dienelactone hydrolase